MADFAIIQTGGKQYKVSAGQKIKVEKLPAADSGKVVFDGVLLSSIGGKVQIGAPHLSSTSLEAKLVGTGRGKKKIIFKYHSKTRQRRKKGHRQDYTEVEIVRI